MNELQLSSRARKGTLLHPDELQNPEPEFRVTGRFPELLKALHVFAGKMPESCKSGIRSKHLAYGARKQGPDHSWRHKFAVVPSFEHPRLVIPIVNRECINNALKLYTPYARQARYMKAALSATLKTRGLHLLHPQLVVDTHEKLGIQNLLAEITGELNPVFAMSIGTPGTYQKLTLSVMRRDGEVLGYMKMPLTPDASPRIRHEASVLRHLHEHPEIKCHVPKCLYDGWLGDRYVLFQSPLGGAPGPLEFSDLHRKFLDALNRVEKTRKAGELIVKEVGARLKAAQRLLSTQWRSLASVIMGRLERRLRGKDILCLAAHGDFAPWNTQISRSGELLVFDWEYGEWDALPSWDLIHFDFQVQSLLGKPSEIDANTGQSGLTLVDLGLIFAVRTVCRNMSESPNEHLLSVLQKKAEDLLRASMED